ncbi:hypothetical protein T08_11384 [Trichinella sp. T8]|nr:hypothetical protein T08_11384 [Trichinella sp. T8]
MLDEIFKFKQSSNMRMRVKVLIKYEKKLIKEAFVYFEHVMLLENNKRLNSKVLKASKLKYQFSSKLVKDAPMKMVPNGDRII